MFFVCTSLFLHIFLQKNTNTESVAVIITAPLTENINKDFISDLIWDPLAIYTMCVVALLHHKTTVNTVGSL